MQNLKIEKEIQGEQGKEDWLIWSVNFWMLTEFEVFKIFKYIRPLTVKSTNLLRTLSLLRNPKAECGKHVY